MGETEAEVHWRTADSERVLFLGLRAKWVMELIRPVSSMVAIQSG
jgi:hypothetical protein